MKETKRIRWRRRWRRIYSYSMIERVQPLEARKGKEHQ
jgi:hypothetical protein